MRHKLLGDSTSHYSSTDMLYTVMLLYVHMHILVTHKQDELWETFFEDVMREDALTGAIHPS
jgi:hypothetical protein